MPTRHPGEESAHRAALDGVRGIYKELEDRPRDRDCRFRTACCQFQTTGRMPMVTSGEALLVEEALRRGGRRAVAARDDGACPFLHPQTARCIVYAERPFGCRTHFCAAAGGDIPRRDVLDLIRRLEEIDAALGGDGPRSLTAALRPVIK